LVPYSKRDGGTRPVPTAAILHLIRLTWGYAGEIMHEVTLLRGIRVKQKQGPSEDGPC
jgi:hypothetical protein